MFNLILFLCLFSSNKIYAADFYTYHGHDFYVQEFYATTKNEVPIEYQFYPYDNSPQRGFIPSTKTIYIIGITNNKYYQINDKGTIGYVKISKTNPDNLRLVKYKNLYSEKTEICGQLDNGVLLYDECPEYVADIIKKCNINAKDSQMKKLLKVCNYLQENVTYDKTLTNSTTKQTLSTMTAKCTGYANTCATICRMLGIESYVILSSNDDGSAGHAWNKFIINGKPLYADLTWGTGVCNYIAVMKDKDYDNVYPYISCSDEI